MLVPAGRRESKVTRGAQTGSFLPRVYLKTYDASALVVSTRHILNRSCGAQAPAAVLLLGLSPLQQLDT